jgi:Mrp family chromosome partitioning ATPase
MVELSEGAVLLVEADLWRPALASLLGAPPGPGLADAILDPTISLEQVIHSTCMPSLNLVPAGRPVRGTVRKTLAASFGQHFRRLCVRFSSVIVTLPSAADPECSLFPFSLPEAVLLVVQPQCTSVKEVQWASRRLRDAGAELIGAMVDETNGVLVEA